MSNQFQEQEYNTESFDRSLWQRISKLLLVHKKQLLYMFLIVSLVAIADVIFPILNRIAIDSLTQGEWGNQQILWFGGAYFALIIIQAFNVYGFIRQAGRVEMDFAYDVRQKAFHKLQELSFSYFDKTPQGWIMARMTSDIGRLAEILSWSLMDLVWGVAVMIGATIAMLIANWKLALLVLVVVPPLAFISVWFQVRILKNYREVRRVNSRITAAFSEGISGAKTIKTLVLEDHQDTEFQDLTNTMKSRSIKAAVLSSIFMPIVMGLSSLSVGALLWYGGHEVLVGSIQFGILMMFTQYATQFFEPLRQIARLIAELQLAQASAERILTLLEAEPEIVDKVEVIKKYGTVLEAKKENYEPMIGNIRFKDIEFYYNADEPVLKDFNLEVKAGEMIALVGETGSGKSTIVNLLCRFYEPIHGEVLIDEKDYRERSIGWLHENLGYVLQAPHLFSGTVKDNIRYGKLDATDEEIIAAAKYVNAHNFIMKLEKGYDSEVGEGGGRLSTGEKQLISFARAVIRKPAIFVLDEATSSIDTQTEQIIQEAISQVLKGKTSFIIAHRLSTIVSADKILVIRKGEITEQGTHQELLKKKGYYYRLYTNQFHEELQNQLLNKA